MSEMQKVVVAQFLNGRLAGEFSYVPETNSFKYERAHFVMLIPVRKAFQFGKNNVRVKSQLLVWVILTDSFNTDGIEIISSKYESEICNNVFLNICARDLA